MKRMNLFVWTCLVLITMVAPGYAVDHLVLENKTLVSGQVERHYAGNSVTAGPNFVIQDGAAVTLTAGNEINLLPDFDTYPGSGLSLEIAECDSTDSVAPVVTGCPENIQTTVALPATSTPITWTPPTATDNTGVVTFSSTHYPGETFAGGTTSVTYTASDCVGNTATCGFSVTVNVINPDTDSDGLRDDWELRFFGNLVQGADGDPDGDGLTNLQEFQQGTDPNIIPTASITAPTDYDIFRLMPGVTYYLDAPHTLVTVPAELLTGVEELVRTRNQDSSITLDTFLTLTLTENAWVYVACDSRAVTPPSWLGDHFTATALQMDVSDSAMGHFVLYKKRFPAGTVVLGGNMAAGAAGAASNYVVIVQPDSSLDFTPPAWSGTAGIAAATDDVIDGQVTVEFGTATDDVDGANVKYNLYYAPASSWDNADWTQNNPQLNITPATGANHPNAHTVTGLTNDLGYTFGIRAADQAGNEDTNTVTISVVPTLPPVTGNLLVPSEYLTIQAAIDRAATGAAVIVADGSHTGPGNRDVDFKGKAITVRSANGPQYCTIDCQGLGRGFYFHTGEGSGSILSGFTIKNGFSGDKGGGILCDDVSPTIENCVIQSSEARFGGGICNYRGAPAIRNCRVIDNTAERGGGIYDFSTNATIANCMIRDNTARDMTGDTYSGGGGIYTNQSAPTVTNCVLKNNRATSTASYAGGGGIYCRDFAQSASFVNCTIIGNQSNGDGGGVRGEYANRVVLSNCILWHNTPTEICDEQSIFHVSDSNIEGGGYGGSNDQYSNIMNRDPLFLTSYDYHLSETSPCRNACPAAGAPLDDMDGDTRDGADGVVDMGADEYTAAATNTIKRVPGEFTTIQAAIDTAVDGDTVLVANGTYSGPENKNLDFAGKAIAVASENGPENCIIDCQGSGRGFYLHSGEGGSSVISGFTIKNGNVGATETGGGGIYFVEVSAVVENCIIRDNYGYYGGGVNIFKGAPVLKDCTIQNNTCHDKGGGLYLNQSTAVISETRIRNNNSPMRGGGVEICWGGAPVFVNCLVAENSALYTGAVYIHDNAAASFTNCTISRNSATDSTGGVLNFNNSNATFKNCILWGNQPGSQLTADNATCNVTYSLVQGGWAGQGNVDGAPNFVGGADYHLTAASVLCVDRGTSAGAPGIDIDNQARPCGAGIDMGADEFVGDLIPEYTITASAGPGGVITPSGPVKVFEGGSQTFFIKENDGYRLTAVTINGTRHESPVTSYTLANITSDQTIAAEFEAVTPADLPPNTWTLLGNAAVSWADAPEVGTVRPYSGNGPTGIAYDPVNLKWLIIRDNAYWILLSDGTWQDSGLLENLWQGIPAGTPAPLSGVTAVFHQDGLWTVFQGERWWQFNQSFAYQNSGLLSVQWSDAPRVGGIKPYEAGGLTAAAFDPATQRWFFVKDNKYWINGVGKGWLDQGYLAAIWHDAPEYDGDLPLGGITGLHFNNGDLIVLKGNKGWRVTMPETHVIQASVIGAGGTISPMGNTLVVAGRSQTYTFGEDDGYQVTSIIIDSTQIEAPAPDYTFTHVASDHTIAVEFAEIPSVNFCANTWTNQVDATVGWDGAPPVGVVYPYSGDGPSGIGYDATNGKWLIIKDSAYWILQSDGSWSRHGFLQDLWQGIPNNGPPPPVNGITAVAYQDGVWNVFQGERYWQFTQDFSYITTALLSAHWLNVQPVGGVMPYEAGGPTAAAFDPVKQRWLFIKDNKYWINGVGVGWIRQGYLAAVWADATENSGKLPLSGITGLFHINGNLTILRGTTGWVATLPETYNMTVEPPVNGSISPAVSRICEGEDIAYTFTPDSGYSIQKLFIDGEPAGHETSYTFTGVDRDHTVRVDFVPTDLLDRNLDGLPDDWQREYFDPDNIDCDNCGANDDYDGDGVSNLMEYKLGSDPSARDVDGPGIFYEYDALGRIKKIIRVPTP